MLHQAAEIEEPRYAHNDQSDSVKLAKMAGKLIAAAPAVQPAYKSKDMIVSGASAYLCCTQLVG